LGLFWCVVHVFTKRDQKLEFRQLRFVFIREICGRFPISAFQRKSAQKILAKS
jgi:hypothetical protein